MKKNIVVMGAGGHAKVCIELLRTMGENVACCIGGPDSPPTCLYLPVLKGDENLALLRSQGYSRLFIAIGSNKIRGRLGALALEQGYQLINAISPHAVISPSARLGFGVAVMAGVVINAETRIGHLSIINTSASVDHDCQIGQVVHIAPQCALSGNVAVGNYSFLGIGSKVIPDVNIGENVMIGAGSVVISHIETGVTAMGVPAKRVILHP